MNRQASVMLMFSLAFAGFFLGPPLLSWQFGPYPMMKVGEALDLLSPAVLIPLYWLLLRVGRDDVPDLLKSLLFLALAGLWAQGQGMHLSANSIGHLLLGSNDSGVYTVAYFYDEVLSHYIWHLAVIGLSALLVFWEWTEPIRHIHRNLWLEIIASAIYGSSFFVIIIEGGTPPLGVTFALLFVLYCLWRGKDNLAQKPLRLFFFSSYLLAIVLFSLWGAYWRALPQFSELGYI